MEINSIQKQSSSKSQLESIKDLIQSQITPKKQKMVVGLKENSSKCIIK